MTSKKEAKKIAKLAKAAGMTMAEFNTGIVLSEDNSYRIGIKGGFQPYEDMVAVQFMFETKPGEWYFNAITPANARVLAYYLNRMADLKEGKLK